MASRKEEEAVVKLSIKNMPFASFFVRAIPVRKEIKLSDTITEQVKKDKKLAKKAPAKKKSPAKKPKTNKGKK